MYNLETFEKSRWHLVIAKNQKIIFKSRARGLKPLIIFINKFGRRYTDLIIFDKIVGRAAALLQAYLKTSMVYTPMISHGAVSVLKKYKISFVASKRVKHIIDLASKELCQWEKLAKNKTLKKFWQLVKNM